MSLPGRERELARACDAVARGGGIVTITGPPGVGKSHLAGAVCTALAPRPVWRCETSRVSTEAEFVQAVAAAIGLGATSDVVEAGTVERALQGRGPSVVLLDDLDDLVLLAGPLIQDWSERCAETAFLITSREPLLLRHETTIEVAPLPLDAALQLLAARAATPEALRAAPRADQEALVERLDRIPLAIELAAAQLSVLSVQQIASRLDDGLAVLHSPLRDLPTRRSSLAAAIKVSWNLLDDALRDVLRGLSPFPGPFRIESAEAVLAHLRGRRVRLDDELAALRTKSLILAHPAADGSMRLSLYRSVREFVRTERTDSETLRALDAAFAEAFLDEGRRHLTRLGVDGDLASRSWARAEAGNLVAAAGHLVESARTADAVALLELLGVTEARSAHKQAFEALLERLLRQAAALEATDRARLEWLQARQLRMGGSLREAGLCCERAAAALEGATSPLRGALLLESARVAYSRGALDGAMRFLDDVETATAASADDRLRGEALRLRATIHLTCDRLALARDDADRAVAAFARARDPRGGAAAAIVQANASIIEGRLRDARVALTPAWAGAQAAGDTPSAGHIAALLGLVAIHEARHADAEEWLDAACRLHRDDGDVTQEARALLFRAVLEHDRGRLDAADQWLDDVLPAFADGSMRGKALALAHRGLVALERRALHDARRDLDDAISMLSGMRDTRSARLFGVFARAAHGARASSPEENDAEIARVSQLLAGPDTDMLPADGDAAGAIPSFYVRLAGRLAAAPHVTAVPHVAAASERPRPARAVDPMANVVTRDGRWLLVAGGDVVDLSRRVALHRMLRALVHAWSERGGAALSADQLAAAGWPGERMLPESARGRVYVAIRTLRRLALDGLLETVGEGYRLAPDAAFVWVDEDELRSP